MSTTGKHVLSAKLSGYRNLDEYFRYSMVVVPTEYFCDNYVQHDLEKEL